MLKLQCTHGGDFHILNLSDPQLKIVDWAPEQKSGLVFKKTVDTLIKRVSPDLITLSGDVSYPGDMVSYRSFAEFFESYGIPWTCCFGNHDNQEGIETVQKALDVLTSYSCFLYEDCDESLGKGNFVILIEKNGKPAEGVFLMDTHDREFYMEDNEEKFHWAKLTEKQLAWYEEQVASLEALGCHDSTLIVHIPISAYRAAFKAAFNGELVPREITIEDCQKPGVWNPGYEDSYGVSHEPNSCSRDDGVLERLKKLGSTKTVLCGHNHTNNWIIRYEGVRLVYAMKTGCGCYWEPCMNGGTVLTVSDDGVSSVKQEYVDVSEYL